MFVRAGNEKYDNIKSNHDVTFIRSTCVTGISCRGRSCSLPYACDQPTNTPARETWSMILCMWIRALWPCRYTARKWVHWNATILSLSGGSEAFLPRESAKKVRASFNPMSPASICRGDSCINHRIHGLCRGPACLFIGAAKNIYRVQQNGRWWILVVAPGGPIAHCSGIQPPYAHLVSPTITRNATPVLYSQTPFAQECPWVCTRSNHAPAFG